MGRRLSGGLLVGVGGVGLALVVALWAASGVGGSILNWLPLVLLPGLLVAAGLGILRGSRNASTSRRGAGNGGGVEDGPVETAPVTVTGIPEGPVTCCMRCGNLGVRPAPLAADALFAEYRCSRCNFRGQPLEFDTGDAYVAFVRGLHQGGEN